jgi:hypothetical protein
MGLVQALHSGVSRRHSKVAVGVSEVKINSAVVRLVRIAGFPEIITDGVNSNSVERDRAEESVTVQTLPMTTSHPVHALKIEFAFAVGVIETTVPSINDWLQPVEHPIPGGDGCTATEPPPVPPKRIVSGHE